MINRRQFTRSRSRFSLFRHYYWVAGSFRGFRLKPKNFWSWSRPILFLSDILFRRNWYNTVSKLYQNSYDLVYNSKFWTENIQSYCGRRCLAALNKFHKIQRNEIERIRGIVLTDSNTCDIDIDSCSEPSSNKVWEIYILEVLYAFLLEFDSRPL